MDISDAILTLLATVLTGVLGMLGTYAAKLMKDKIGIAGIQKIDACLSQKKELASIAVKFAQQAYKDLGGEEKLAKAAEYMSTVAQKNGIRLNSDEIVGLLESSLKEAKNTFSDTWKKASASGEVTPQIDIIEEAPAFVQELFPGTMTFGQYLDKWLAFRKSKLAPKTYHSYYCEIERHIKPNIGNILLQELEAIDLQEYYYKMETEGRIKPENIKGRKKEEDSKKKNPRKEVSPGLSQRTIYYHHRIISTALKQAAKWKMIPQNPALLVDAPSYKKKEMSFLKKSELEQFFKEVKEEMDYPVIYAGVMTGMRQGELLGLRWRDVDFDTGMINIRQQLQYMPGEGVFFKTPKSIKSIRSIPMQLPLSKMFRNIKRAQESYQIEEFKKLKREEVGELTESDLKKVYDDHDLVLCRNNGKPLDASKLTNRFKELVIKFGRPDIRFHDLRHTFAALAIAAGITMDKLQRIMGHESITTTIDMYGHIPEDALSEEMKKLSEYLGFETLAE